MISSSTIRRACKIAHVAAVQPGYSVLTRDIEGPAGPDMLATCRELGVAVVPATPLERGLITPNYAGEAKTDVRSVMPRFQEGNRDHNFQVVSQFKALADKKGCTVAQLALAWLLKQGDDIFPIPGTKRIQYLEQNWDALNVSLSDEDEAEIRDFAQNVELAGGPVPKAFESYLYRDTKEMSS